jgi:hypothetical protein
MGFLDKVKNLVANNADKVDTAIDKVGDIVDQKTGNKYAGAVDKVQDAAKKAAREQAGAPPQQPQVPPTQQSGQAPPPQQPPAAPPAQQPPTAPPTS